MWSLGVDVMEYAYGLPQRRKQRKAGRKQCQRTTDKNWELEWCGHLVEAVVDWDSDNLIDFLTECMLKWSLRERPSAADCLNKGLGKRLFNGAFGKTDNITPHLEQGGHTHNRPTKKRRLSSWGDFGSTSIVSL